MASFETPKAKTPRESAFRKELVWASVLFSFIFVAVIGLGSYIIIKDLGEKEVFHVLNKYSQELQTMMAKIPTTQSMKGYKQRKIVITRLNQFLTEKKIFDSYALYDEKGRPVTKKDFLLQGSILGGSNVGQGLKPGQSKVQYRHKIPIEVQVPIEPGKMGKAILNVSEDVLAKQARQFRRQMIAKLVGLMGIILLLVVAAYLYILRVLRLSRRIEAEAQRQERLSYLGLLSSGLAHEIKNPLNSMQINLQMLMEDLESQGGQKEPLGLLTPISREVKRLEQLVNEFLLYARPMRPHLANVQIRQIFQGISTLVGEEAKRRGVNIEISCPSNLPAVLADDSLLRTALMNLVLNSIQASGKSGSVLMKAEAHDRHIVIEVSDTGPGIPPDRQGEIFQIFYTTKPGGTGLGLPIARRIFENHGGSLDYAGDGESGGRFRAILPLQGKQDAVEDG
jgi:signal transduction histidine kinase